MEELKKVIKIAIFAIGLIWLLGLVITVIGEKLSADLMTIGIIFFTGYGIVAFVKKLKEKG